MRVAVVGQHHIDTELFQLLGQLHAHDGRVGRIGVDFARFGAFDAGIEEGDGRIILGRVFDRGIFLDPFQRALPLII